MRHFIFKNIKEPQQKYEVNEMKALIMAVRFLKNKKHGKKVNNALIEK